MKKIVLSVATVITLFCATSCGGDTAADKALDIVGYMQDGNYASFVDELHEVPGKEISDIKKKQLVLMFEEKGGESIKKKGGIESFALVSEKLSKDGNSATVEVSITYGDATTDKEKLKMIKDANGEWKNKIK